MTSTPETLDVPDVPDVLTEEAALLVGTAGTGKTTLARHMAASMPGTVLAATTGIASVNLGEGTTINSLLGYFNTASLGDSFNGGYLTTRLGKLWKAGVRRILIDEVSMMHADQLTMLALALDDLAGRKYVLDAELDDEVAQGQEAEGDLDERSNRRWPIKLVLIGDPCQLPPVPEKNAVTGKNMPIRFPFDSEEWGRFAQNTHVLTEIKRQGDGDFVRALQAARRGDREMVAEYFRPHLVTQLDTEFEGPTLFARNEEVDRYNALRLSKVAGAAGSYLSTRWVREHIKPRGDWRLIPEQLKLKIGALVMILANQKVEGTGEMLGAPLIYANGDLGHVVDFGKETVTVTLVRNNAVVEVVPVTRKYDVPLEPGRTKVLKEANELHMISGNGKMETVGQISYLPLRVAFGSTVHKTQGLSLDRVQVNTRDYFFKSPSMLYVALSRARTIGGLRLVGTVDGLRERCTVHPKVMPWV